MIIEHIYLKYYIYNKLNIILAFNIKFRRVDQIKTSFNVN
jgi:hypothetical protein